MINWLTYKENVEIWINDGYEEKLLQLFPVPKKLINELNQKIETGIDGSWIKERDNILNYIGKSLIHNWYQFYPANDSNNKSKLIRIVKK